MADGSKQYNGCDGDFRGAFKSRDFRLYQAARLMVIVGAEAQSVAVAWQVYQLTHSALDLGYTGLALFLPGLFVMLAAGHAADRYDRRKDYSDFAMTFRRYVRRGCCTCADWLSREDLADLCCACGDRAGAGVQRAGGQCDDSEPGAEGTLCECGDVGRDGLSDCEYVGAGSGGNLFTLPLAGARHGGTARRLCMRSRW